MPVSATIPTLETERLILRGIKRADFEPFAAFMATDAAHFIGGPCEPALAWRQLAAYAGDWLLRGYSKFALEEKASGRFVGIVGPWFPVGWPEPEIAWTVMPEFQSTGMAREAALRALRFAYEDLGWPTAVSCMDPENEPSIRLARSLGAVPEGETEIRPYGRALLYRHVSPAELLSGPQARGAA
ncbi:MAG: GNAT family N-acetyltransferase [Rhizobiaceae bacterium]